MKILTVYAHHDPRSFCHGVLERFNAGLTDAGHTNDVLDLYAIKFDPVFREQDVASYTSGTIPPDILELMDLEARVLDSCRGPLQRFLASRAMRGKSRAEIAAMIRDHMPRDVLAQQEKVAAADALAFIAPVHFCSFPSILKGWIDRVFTLDFAFGLTSEGWRGDINGRIPLLHHERALIMTSTIFDENAYDDGIRDAIARVIDDWGFRYPGIKDVEHIYFYAATTASPDTIHGYLDQAYQLGKDFGVTRDERASLTTDRGATGPAADDLDEAEAPLGP
jgi:NAD(P)H dehydrogenase (quinone)